MRLINNGSRIAARIEIIAGLIFTSVGVAILSGNKWIDNIFLSIISFWKGKPLNPLWLGKLHLYGEVILVAGTFLFGLFILQYWDRLKQGNFLLKTGRNWERLKQNKVVLILTPIGAIFFIWIVITVNEFSFSFIGNEADVLPSIKQVVDYTWLPNDWYLNLNISYRQLFDFIFGQLVSKLGFVYGAYVGRVIVYLLLSVAIYIFFRTLHLRPIYGILVLLFFLNRQSLIAGEWIVGGLETKTVAYALVILSFSLFLRKHYFSGFAFAGAAISLHVLIGGYALFCIGIAILLNASWRSDWRLYLKNFWPVVITGIFGWWSIIDQLLPQSGIDQNKAWNIYVQVRVPQHVLPSAWNGTAWMAELALAIGFFTIMYLLTDSKTTRFVASFALGSIALFLVGLIIYGIGDIQLLRFYWFRFPDVMIPFLGAILSAVFLNDFADESIFNNSIFQFIHHGLQTMMRLLPPIIIFFFIVMLTQQTYKLRTSYLVSLNNEPGSIFPAFDWISKNTPQQATFLVDPSEKYFYIYAQRARLVSWKSAPQSAAAILEWYKRIKLCNGNVELVGDKHNDPSDVVHTNFYKLDEDQIQQIADQYGTNYYLGLANQKLNFDRVYSDSTYAVYKIR